MRPQEVTGLPKVKWLVSSLSSTECWPAKSQLWALSAGPSAGCLVSCLGLCSFLAVISTPYSLSHLGTTVCQPALCFWFSFFLKCFSLSQVWGQGFPRASSERLAVTTLLPLLEPTFWPLDTSVLTPVSHVLLSPCASLASKAFLSKGLSFLYLAGQ